MISCEPLHFNWGFREGKERKEKRGMRRWRKQRKTGTGGEGDGTEPGEATRSKGPPTAAEYNSEVVYPPDLGMQLINTVAELCVLCTDLLGWEITRARSFCNRQLSQLNSGYPVCCFLRSILTSNSLLVNVTVFFAHSFWAPLFICGCSLQ